MASEKARVPAAAKTADRNHLTESWKNSDDKAPSPLIQLMIVVSPATGRPGAFAARLEGESTVLVVSRAPFLASAWKLIAAGYPPDAVFMMRRGGAEGFDLKARLGKAAKLTIEESAHGPVFRTVRYGPPSAVSGSQDPVPESSLGEPRFEAPAEPVIEEPSCAFGSPSVAGGLESLPAEQPQGEPRPGAPAVEKTACAPSPPGPVKGSEKLPPALPPRGTRLDMPPDPVVEQTSRTERSAVKAANNAKPEMPLESHPDGTGHGAAAKPMARKSATRSVRKGSRSAVDAASDVQWELPLGGAHDEAA
jgi:hypothetical protein